MFVISVWAVHDGIDCFSIAHLVFVLFVLEYVEIVQNLCVHNAIYGIDNVLKLLEEWCENLVKNLSTKHAIND